jgi:pimeloyl-ACP methyl ester carboxylesterase
MRLTHYIYLPGLGDHVDPLRRFILRKWEWFGVRTTLVPMHWTDKSDTYEQKYERIVDVIMRSESKKIVLVGESAGGAMALLTFSRQSERIDSIVTICGYNHGADDLKPKHRDANMSFYRLLLEVERILDDFSPQMRQHITTIYSKLDQIVSPDHSRIEGAHARVLYFPGHAMNITRKLLAGPKGLQ